MSQQPGENPDGTHDQDAEPASQPDGAAAEEAPAEDEDQDAGPASQPDV
ncbi:hypothetical protein [Nocardioides pantholopis]|nr:hypothetical protein [Nocardioides pantholopis]